VSRHRWLSIRPQPNELPFVGAARAWKCYDSLPKDVPTLAGDKFKLFEREPFHRSLGLQQKGNVWTLDIGRSSRAIAYRDGNDFHRFWIGSHEEYNNLLRRWK
jgi:hypothetical protein